MYEIAHGYKLIMMKCQVCFYTVKQSKDVVSSGNRLILMGL